MKLTGKEKTKEKESRSRRKADYLSVYDLFLRSGGCKVGIVIALTLLAEAITLVVLMQGETMYYENLFARNAALPLGIGFLLLTLALIDPLRAQKSNVDYTIRRLHIRPLDVFWVETVYVLLAYFVFWALNVTLLYALEPILQVISRRQLTGRWGFCSRLSARHSSICCCRSRM